MICKVKTKGFKSMKYFLIFIISVFYFPSAFARVCEESFSADGIDKGDFLRRADEQLEKVLQKIRKSPQEPVLKAQGFKPIYYRGVDQAREFNEVAKYLRVIQADPKKTHIPYFARQIEKTIADFENSFRNHNQDKPEFLAEKLKLLEALKTEAQRRVTDQNVTYDWWATFNLRLSIIASSDITVVIRRINWFRIQDKFKDPAERVMAGIEIDYNKKLVQRIKEMIRSRLKEIRRDPRTLRRSKKLSLQKAKTKLKQLNPRKILFEGKYTSVELEKIRDEFFKNSFKWDIVEEIADEKGWYDNNHIFKTHEKVQELLSYIDIGDFDSIKIVDVRTFIRTKQQFPKEIMFFTTDELGIMAFNKLEDTSHFIGVSGNPVVADALERSSFGFFGHDLTHANQAKILKLENFQKISERIGSISNKADREKAELALFMYRHEIAYGLFGIGSRASNDGISDYTNIDGISDYTNIDGISDYTNIDTNLLSPSELSQLRADAKEYARENIYKKHFFSGTNRFLDHEDLQEMLPESVNINNPEEVKNFLTETVGIFVDIVISH